MSSNIVLPSTSDWVKSHLTALYSSKSDEEFTRVFDSFIARSIDSIIFNGQQITRDEYKQIISGEKLGQAFKGIETVVSRGVVDVPSLGSFVEKDIVGASFTATTSIGIKLHGADEVIKKVESTIIVEIQEDRSIPVPRPPSGIHGVEPDIRRVYKLTQVLSFTGPSGIPEYPTQA